MTYRKEAKSHRLIWHPWPDSLPEPRKQVELMIFGGPGNGKRSRIYLLGRKPPFRWADWDTGIPVDPGFIVMWRYIRDREYSQYEKKYKPRRVITK